MKALKATKQRIVLTDGRELQFHVPEPQKGPYKGMPDEMMPNQMMPNEMMTDTFWDSFCEEFLQKFSGSRALEVEIGPGKGEFLAHRARSYPERFFLGIDRRDDRTELTQKKLKRFDTEKNCMILNEDARSLLPAFSNRLPPLEILHIYHPDPWPKKRHFKHRFFRSPDAKQWAERIKVGGELRISTDHRGYFEEIIDIIESWNFLELRGLYRKESHMGEPQSHFESIFLKKKEPVFKAVFFRTENQPGISAERPPERPIEPKNQAVLERSGFRAAATSDSVAL